MERPGHGTEGVSFDASEKVLAEVLRREDASGPPWCPAERRHLASETIRIAKDQRDALYEQVRTHLAALGDIWIALEGQNDYATAERL